MIKFPRGIYTNIEKIRKKNNDKFHQLYNTFYIKNYSSYLDYQFPYFSTCNKDKKNAKIVGVQKINIITDAWL